MKAKKAPLLVIPLVIIAAVITAVTIRNNPPDTPGFLSVSGNIEVVDAEVAFKIAGRVVERTVDEGDIVEKDRLIARLDDSELAGLVAVASSDVRASQAALDELLAGSRPEEIAAAEATVQAAQAALDELLAGSRPEEIAAAEAAVESARAKADNLRADFERLSELFKTSAISGSQYDSARTAYDSAVALLAEATQQFALVKQGPRKERITAARAVLAQAAENAALVKKGPRQETIDAARARLEQSTNSLALARTRLSYAAIYAPLAGVVLSKNIEPGEYVAPGTPVVTVGDLKNVFLRAYVNETDLGRAKIGQDVTVTTDTYPGKSYKGRISFISPEAEFTPKSVQTPKERVKLVYRIKVDLPNPDMDLKAGMPADAVIATGDAAP